MKSLYRQMGCAQRTSEDCKWVRSEMSKQTYDQMKAETRRKIDIIKVDVGNSVGESDYSGSPGALNSAEVSKAREQTRPLSELSEIFIAAASHNQVPPGYSKENFDSLVNEKGYEAKYYDGADLLKYSVVSEADYNRYMESVGFVQRASITRDVIKIPALTVYYSNFQYQQNIKGYDPGYVELDNGAKHYSDLNIIINMCMKNQIQVLRIV